MTVSEPPPGRRVVDLRTDVPHPARVYDYWLGGKDNFAADREAAEAVIAVRPTIIRDIRANRAFMRRAVAWLASEAGIAVHELVPRHASLEDAYLDLTGASTDFRSAGHTTANS